jgi:CBS domain-containing protein
MVSALGKRGVSIGLCSTCMDARGLADTELISTVPERTDTMHVRDIMNHPVITCPSESNLNLVAQLMWEHDCGTIPVVDQEGRLAGIVTDRDICMAAYTQGALLESIPVTTAMAKHVLACHLDDSIETAEELMREGQIRRVPVIDNDARPVGIVAMNDLARLAARAKKSGVDREIVQTLAAVCAPRLRPDRLQTDHAAGPVTLA